MTKKSIKFAGHNFDLYPSGALFLPEYGVMVISDLHLEKEAAFSSRPTFIQTLDTLETLARVNEDAENLNPKKIILLGDIFHDAGSFERMSIDHIDKLYDFIKQHNIVWVEGNHSGGFSPPNVDMRIEYSYLNLNFRHIATDNEDFEISGHYHPRVTIDYKNEKVKRKCFVCDKTKLIVPAFGSFKDGMEVTDPAIRNLFSKNIKVYPLTTEKVYGLNPERISGH